jgi:hypothetical protein
MPADPPRLAPPIALLAASLLAAIGLSGCSGFEIPLLKKLGAGGPKDGTLSKEEQAEHLRTISRMNAEAQVAENLQKKVSAAAANIDLGFLLGMTYEEAKAISAQSVEMPSEVRVAADSIEVLKKDRAERPVRIRAKGRVYLESGTGEDVAKVLCHEAYVSSWEIVLRGKPIIQRGNSTIEGLEDETVAYMFGGRLRVLGLHRLTNQTDMLAKLPDLGPWTEGPNPLLPPLTEAAVPNDIRDQMMKAAEAEAVLQQKRAEALSLPADPPAPWVKEEAVKKEQPAASEKKPE